MSTANRNDREIFIFPDRLRILQFNYPSAMTLSVVEAGKTIPLYSNNYLHVEYSAANFIPQGTLNRCTMIEGMKARVVYSEVSDKSIAGQVLSVELTK